MSLGLIIIIGIASIGVYCLFTGKKENKTGIDGIQYAITENINWIEKQIEGMRKGESRRIRAILGDLDFRNKLIIEFNRKNYNIYEDVKEYIERDEEYTVAITANRKFLVKKIS